MKIIISGISGQMGQILYQVAQTKSELELVGGVGKGCRVEDFDFPVAESFEQLELEADVVIDFSVPEMTEEVLAWCSKRQIPLLIATTGHTAEELDLIQKHSERIPILKSSNTSFGIYLLEKILREYAYLLEGDYSIEIIEKHHQFKKDAPSGTAKTLLAAIESGQNRHYEKTYGRGPSQKERQPSEIGIHSIRAGSYPGEHSVIFAGNDEIIEFKHTALSKKIFAEGAIKAAKALILKDKGYYEMKTLSEGE